MHLAQNGDGLILIEQGDGVLAGSVSLVRICSRQHNRNRLH